MIHFLQTIFLDVDNYLQQINSSKFSISRLVSHIPFGESQAANAKPRKTKAGGEI